MNFFTPINTFSRQLRLRLTGRILTLLVVAMLAGCANDSDSVINSLTDAYSQAQKSMANGNYSKAIQIFEAIRATFPFSELSKQIELELMYAYYKSNHKEEAIEMAEQFMRENPTDDRVDYALYIEALAYFEGDRTFLERWMRKSIAGRPPRDAEQSFSLFSRLIQRYPASEYAEDAKQRMVYLKNRLAAYENSVAEYYIRTGAFVAALNRAKGALELYDGADSNPQSLELMITAYEGLGLTQLAEDAKRVLSANPTSGT